MENQKIYIKCSGCYCLRGEDEYEIYKGTRRKSCLKCKEKRERRKEKRNEQNKQYYQDNKDKIKEQRKEQKKRYYEELKINNPQMYLVNLQRGSIKRMLKRSDLSKTKSTIEYLGCSPEYFKEYIQNKMTDEMTFDNIHCDHIKPVSRFNLDDPDEFLECCHYTNLQPLLAKDNLEKNNKWTDEDEIYWKENIRGKETTEIYLTK